MQTWTLITGASEGLGAEFARISAREGRSLILTARSEDKLAALAEELRDKAGDIEVIPADLSVPGAADTLWHSASEGRRIDILLNNAGLGSHDRFDDAQAWDRESTSISVNVIALTKLMKEAVAHMRDQGGGRIMNVSSVAGFMPGPNMAVYHATKSYVLSLSEAVAEELRGSDVSVTALCPGATATPFLDAADMHGIALHRLGRPMDARRVAEAGWTAMKARRRLAVPGLRNKLFAFGTRLAPRALVTFLTEKVMRKW